MSTFPFICPFCEQKLECPEEILGMEIECPACKNKIVPFNENPDKKSQTGSVIPRVQNTFNESKMAVDETYPSEKNIFKQTQQEFPDNISKMAYSSDSRKDQLSVAVYVLAGSIVFLSLCLVPVSYFCGYSAIKLHRVSKIMSGFSERKPLSIDYPVSTGSAAHAAIAVPRSSSYQSEYRKRMAEFEKEFKKNLEEAERKIKALQNSYEY